MTTNPPSSRALHGASARRRAAQVALVLTPLLLPGCAALPALMPIALELGRNLFNTAANNYSPGYSEALTGLLSLFKKGPEPGEASPEAPVAETTAATATALTLSVGLLQDRPGSKPREIEDGAVLSDANGNLQESDRFKITFEPSEECYVYVLSIDATAWVTPVFPGAESIVGNPVPAGQEIQIPQGDRWYALDENRGIEEFHFLASRVRRPDLEAKLAEFEGLVRPQKEEYLAVQEPAVLTRGIVAVEPAKPTTVQSESGMVHDVTPSSYFTSVGQDDLVITRWFRHVP